MNIDIDKVCDSVEEVCDDWNVGYSQPHRWDIWAGGSTDCSALTAWAYNQAGALPPFPRDSYTGNLRAYAAARGFETIPYYAGIALKAGDAVLSEQAGHVGIYIGQNRFCEAFISEQGTIDGAPGDQTGGETRTTSFTGHHLTRSNRWDWVLRPPALEAASIESGEETMRFIRSVQSGIVYAATPYDVSPIPSATLWGFLHRTYEGPSYEDFNDGEIGLIAADAAARKARVFGTPVTVNADINEQALASSLARMIPDTLAQSVADLLAERLKA